MRSTSILALAALAATLAAPPALAEDMQTTTDGLRVMRDKETGKLRAPNAAELAEMEASERAARKARGLPEVAKTAPVAVRTYPNGMRSAVLGKEYLISLQAERGPDGKLVVKHSDPRLDPSAQANVRPTE
jgi:hypothetical protein